jgi:pyrimidine-nucleoside phosphorylase
MQAVDLIRKKRDGGVLDPAELRAFVAGACDGTWPDYQLAALLMAMAIRGMTAEETVALTEAMVASGARLARRDFSRPRADKHSTGGVGDKTSLVVAPLAAACGLVVPMMSGRALGHTGGTLDKLEAIPGFRTALDEEACGQVLARAGCAIFGQTDRIAPADRRLYALRDVTATVDSIPLIAASIMSKKLVEDLDALVLDVKVGRGAFMKTEREARDLAALLVEIGERHGVGTSAVLSAMDAPLGRAVGNALEVAESIEALQGRGPADLETLAVELSARMIALAGVESGREAALRRARRALESGAAFERFRAMVAAQGGDVGAVDDPSRLPSAPGRASVEAARAGVVCGVDAEAIGRASMALGAGRLRAGQAIDPAVGVRVLARPGEAVARGQALAELHHRDGAGLDAARALAASAFAIGDEAPDPAPLILGHVGAGAAAS